MNDWFHKEREQSGGEYGRNEFLYRYLIIAAAFLLICAVYTVSAFRIHAVYGNSEDIGNEEYTRRKVTVSAVRGEIYDRNGVKLVGNEYNYTLIYDYSAMARTKSEQNEDILAVLSIVGDSPYRSENKCPMKGTYPDITYDPIILKDSTVKSRLRRIISEYELDSDVLASDLAQAVAKKFAMLDAEGNPKYTPEEMTELIRVRYEMEAMRFSAVWACSTMSSLVKKSLSMMPSL